MRSSNVIPLIREFDGKLRHRGKLNDGKKGSVINRKGILWVDFYYLGKRVRESSGLPDTAENRKKVRFQLDLVVAEIENGTFEFAKRFPLSARKDYFTELEGKGVVRHPSDVVFGEYSKQWLIEMQPGMSDNKKKDFNCAIDNHILPFFGDLHFSEIKKITIKKFVAYLKSCKNLSGKPLSSKSIRTYMIPLRAIVYDAMDEFDWVDFRDPFRGLKLPKPRKRRIQPFNFTEWQILMDAMYRWYRPYFQFAVQTGLRPSEQVALKWSSIDDRFIHIENSVVRGREKDDLKTEGSQRSIELRQSMKDTLAAQRRLTASFDQPYVFLNTKGVRIYQENLGKMWHKALSKSGLRPRRMYETRHTFASWALAAGESPEWVARTLGHVDTTMVYRTYGRFIPNLTRRDGSALEKQFSDAFGNSAEEGDEK